MCNGNHSCSEILGLCGWNQGFKGSLILWPSKSSGPLQGSFAGGRRGGFKPPGKGNRAMGAAGNCSGNSTQRPGILGTSVQFVLFGGKLDIGVRQ